MYLTQLLIRGSTVRSRAGRPVENKSLHVIVDFFIYILHKININFISK